MLCVGFYMILIPMEFLPHVISLLASSLGIVILLIALECYLIAMSSAWLYYRQNIAMILPITVSLGLILTYFIPEALNIMEDFYE